MLLVKVSAACIALLAGVLAVPSVRAAGSAGLPPPLWSPRLTPPRGEQITRFECSYLGRLYHYDLFTPDGYDNDPQRQYPTLFIAEPGGNATLGNSEDWVRSQQWLAVMLVEARNGPADVNDENFLCAHDDVVSRARVHSNMKFATGTSGGARMSARFLTYRPGFRGLIVQAAGICNSYSSCDTPEWLIANKPNLRTFATFGSGDFNLWELNELRAKIPSARLSWEVFAGGHEPAPVATMNRAFAWLQANTVETEYAILGRFNVRNTVSASVALSRLSGVTITVGSASTLLPSPTSIQGDANYYYVRFAVRVTGSTSSAVTPTKTGVTFSPSSRTASLPPEAWNVDFEAGTPPAPTFTDSPLQAGVTPIKAIHVVELRQAIDTLRARFGLAAYAWTGTTLTAGTTTITTLHLTELRTALQAAYVAAGRTPPTYTDATLTARVTLIKAVHLSEIRNAVLALW